MKNVRREGHAASVAHVGEKLPAANTTKSSHPPNFTIPSTSSRGDMREMKKFKIKISDLKRGKKENRYEHSGSNVNMPPTQSAGNSNASRSGSTSKQPILVEDDVVQSIEEGEMQELPGATTHRPEELLGYHSDGSEDYERRLQSPNLDALHLLGQPLPNDDMDIDQPAPPQVTISRATGSTSPTKRRYDQELYPNTPPEKKQHRRSRTPSRMCSISPVSLPFSGPPRESFASRHCTTRCETMLALTKANQLLITILILELTGPWS